MALVPIYKKKKKKVLGHDTELELVGFSKIQNRQNFKSSTFVFLKVQQVTYNT